MSLAEITAPVPEPAAPVARTFGGVVAALLDDVFKLRRRAARYLAMEPNGLATLIKGTAISRKCTKQFWQYRPHGGEKTRLNLLRALPLWPQLEQEFMAFYDDFPEDDFKNTHIRPPNLKEGEATLRDVTDALINACFARRWEAVDAFGIVISRLYNSHITKTLWNEKPEGSDQSRLALLQTSPLWPKLGPAFMAFYEKLPQGQPSKKRTRKDFSNEDAIATLGDAVRVYIYALTTPHRVANKMGVEAENIYNILSHPRVDGGTTKKFWFKKPNGAEQSRLEILAGMATPISNMDNRITAAKALLQAEYYLSHHVPEVMGSRIRRLPTKTSQLLTQAWRQAAGETMGIILRGGAPADKDLAAATKRLPGENLHAILGGTFTDLGGYRKLARSLAGGLNAAERAVLAGKIPEADVPALTPVHAALRHLGRLMPELRTPAVS